LSSFRWNAAAAQSAAVQVRLTRGADQENLASYANGVLAGALATGRPVRRGGAPRLRPEAQSMSASPAGGSWPVTRRDPALGTKTDSEPES
jgi:hypothetical protein